MILNGPGISYTEPDIGSEFVPPLPEHPREAIVKLCEHCTNRLLHRDELLGYEYWSFAEAATDEQAEVLCKMKMRRPYTLPEMVKLTGMPEAQIEKMLDDMSYTGLLEYNWENPERAKQWVLPMLVPGSAEFLNMRVSQLEEHPVYAKFFEQASKGPLSKATPMVPPGGAGIGMHVIPVEKAIDAASTSVPIEHIEHWLDKYEGKYAASTCSCRASRRVMGEGCADDPADWCIAVGDMADYVVETDRGHYVTREEVYDILRQAEDNGFVHQITNIDGENKIFAICNCNVNVCYALRTSQLFNTPNLSRSAYVAKVEKDKCVACGRCVEVCPAGAAKLGQKLCSKKAGGQVPEYPRQELPDATKWDHTKWSPNYRNDNRIETHESGTAPCKTACPAHVAVQGYLKLAAQGRYDEALALIKRENPLPAICGRVCNRRCEDACTRGRVDAAVAIDEVKKFIAQRDLDAEQHQAAGQPAPQHPGVGQRDGPVGRAPCHPHQQGEGGQATQQVTHHHDGLQQPRHRPHAEQRLEDDHRQRQGGGARQVDVRPAQGREQQDGFTEDRQRRRGDVLAVHVQRDGGTDQPGGRQDLRDAPAAATRGQQGQHQHQHAQRRGDVAMHLFAPRLVGLERTDLAGHVRSRFVDGLRPCGAAVTGRPVRAAQAGIGQAHERAEHDRARGHDHGEPRQAVEIAVQRRTRGKAHQTGLTSVSATWPCPCAGHRGRNPGHGA